MTTQPLRFNVLAAPIASIDRRSLSQAWYSALHLAQEAQPPCQAAPAAIAAPSVRRKSTDGALRTSSSCKPPKNVVVRRRTEQRPRIEAAADRRAARSFLARKIEATFLHPSKKISRATFTIDGSNAKVHVSIRSTQRGICLVAVCAPRLRALVARALEEARYALAARGMCLDASVAD